MSEPAVTLDGLMNPVKKKSGFILSQAAVEVGFPAVPERGTGRFPGPYLSRLDVLPRSFSSRPRPYAHRNIR